MICELKSEVVVISGDMFEDENDEETGSWKPQSQNEKLQEISRAFLKRIADIIVPGHGRFFKVKETAEARKSGYISPEPIKEKYLNTCTTSNNSSLNEIYQFDSPSGSVIVAGGGLETIDWSKYPHQGRNKLIYVHVGTKMFKIPFDLKHLPNKFYMETDVYTRKDSGEEEYSSTSGEKTVNIESDEFKDGFVIWRIPGPGGFVYPVFHFVENDEFKFILGSCTGVDSDETKNVLFRLLLRNIIDNVKVLFL